MSPETKRRIKLWLRKCAEAVKLAARRWALRRARYLFDAIEERLHNAEVRLRSDLEQRTLCAGVGSALPGVPRAPFSSGARAAASYPGPGSLPQPAPTRHRKRYITAHDFDLRFSSAR